ncbi:hypothetical protein evm_006656 [Chilo suppressalis]|nr:hypothetical protein evm_006656 [Chilo suppressalis]
MVLQNSNVEVSTSLVKAKLLNEMYKTGAFNNNFTSEIAKSVKSKQIICYDCKEHGHNHPDCPLRKKKSDKKKNMVALVPVIQFYMVDGLYYLDCTVNTSINKAYDVHSDYQNRDPSSPRKLIKARDVTFFQECFSDLNAVTSNNSDTNINISLPVLLFSDTVEGTQHNNDVMIKPANSLESTQGTSTSSIIVKERGSENVVLEPIHMSSDVVNNSSEHESERPYKKRDRKPPDFLWYVESCDDSNEPQTFSEVMKANASGNWKEAMHSEYSSLLKLKTWKLVDRPDTRVIRCKWVYKQKRDADGNIIKYKARIVAKGYSQVACVDYYETFAPVVRHSSLRTLFALAAQRNLKMRHMDVETAFLNGDLEEHVYMEQPEGNSDNDVFIHQKSYILNLLKKFGMENCKTCSTPMTNTKLKRSPTSLLES